MIAIIDYDAGNLKSVEKALNFLGEETLITRDKKQLLQADKVILPGVGAFKDAMDNIHRFELADVIKEVIQKETPFLGICLGLQLLFEHSEENPGTEGLGILKGEILRIPDCPELKIPHMGWNSLTIKPGALILKNLPENPYMYFVHSYYLKAADRDIVAATTEYSTILDVSIQSGNLFACQFHPEKSSKAGLQILKNFAELGKERE